VVTILEIIRSYHARGGGEVGSLTLEGIDRAVRRVCGSIEHRRAHTDAYVRRGVKYELTGVLTASAGDLVAEIDTAFTDKSARGACIKVGNEHHTIVESWSSGGTNYVLFDRPFVEDVELTDAEAVRLVAVPKAVDGTPLATVRSGLTNSRREDRVHGDRRVLLGGQYHGFGTDESLPTPPKPAVAVGGTTYTSEVGKYIIRAAYRSGDRISELSEGTEISITGATEGVTSLSLPYSHFNDPDVIYTAEGIYDGATLCGIAVCDVGPRSFDGGDISRAEIMLGAAVHPTVGSVTVKFGADVSARNENVVGWRMADRIVCSGQWADLPPRLVDAAVEILMYYSTGDITHLRAANYAITAEETHRAQR
jgi:hypothetical protein